MADEPDYIVEIGGRVIEGPPGRSQRPGSRRGDVTQARSYVSILFECCNVYQRVYRNRSGTAYEGYCPRCSQAVRLRIGPDGTSCRFFSAR